MVHDPLARILRPPGDLRRVRRASEFDEVIDERPPSGDIQRIRPHYKEHTWPPRAVAALSFDLTVKRGNRPSRVARQACVDLRHRSGYVGQTLRPNDHQGDADRGKSALQ